MKALWRAVALALGSMGILAGAGPASAGGSLPKDISSYGRLAFKTFTDREGLPQNGIWTLAVDHDGYVWAGTPGGLARYNGFKWASFVLPSKDETFWINQGASAFTADGALWFGTRRAGAFRWKDGQWHQEGSAQGLPGDNVNAILESHWPDERGRRRLWMATYDGGLAYRDDQVWHPVGGLPTRRLFCLAETRHGSEPPRLWVGTDQGLFTFQDGRWRPFERNDALAGKQVRCLAVSEEDGQEVVWIGTDESGLGEWRGGRLTMHRQGPGLGLPSDHILALLPTRTLAGRPALWVGTQGGGLAQVEAGKWRVLDRSSGLPSNLVRSLAESITPEGQRTLWIGTDGKGVARLVEGGWAALRTPWESADPRGQDFIETVDAKGVSSYWMGGFTWGLARFKAGVWSRWEKPQGLPDNRVRCLFAFPGAQDRDDLWVGCNEGLAHLQGSQWTVFGLKDGLPSDTIRCLNGQLVEGRPVIWAGTSMGLARLENGRAVVFGRKEGLPDASIRCIEVDGPRLWIGTDSGIACLEGGRIRSYGTSAGLSNQSIACLYLEKDAPGGPLLWVGTYGGGVNLVREREGGLEVRVLGEHTTPALPSEVVASVEKDHAGRVYLFTNRGVARLRRDPQATGGLDVETYALEDGLPGLECLVGASMVDRGGRIWAGTVDGMAVFDPGAEFVDRSPKRLRLESVALDGRPLPMEQRQRIEGRNRSFSFDYTLLSYHREGETRFRTQLEGLEEQPTDWLPESKREYPHLPAGSYVFKVWGRDFAGNVSGPERFAFTVPPSPWLSWWAIALYAVAALGLFDLAARWRHRTLEGRTRELEAKVAQRTEEVMRQAARLEALNQDLVRLNMEKNEFMGIAAHDLRNPLANITLLSEALCEAEDLFSPEERKDRLRQMAEKSHEMAEILGKLLDVNAIEAGRLDLSFSTFDLLPIVKEVVQDYEARAQAKGITLHLQHERQVLEVYAANLQVKQVLENLVSNAVKYSPPHRSVWIALAELPSTVFLQVKDEGAGFTDSDKHKVFNRFTKLSARPTGGESSTGLGLSIARRLVEAMHGRIWVESEAGKGSSFCVELPKPL